MFAGAATMMAQTTAQTETQTVAQPQVEKISLDLTNTNLAEALTQIGNANKDIKIQFVYDELKNMPVSTQIDNLTTEQAINNVIGELPVYVFFTPTEVIVESQEHEGESQIANKMNDDIWRTENLQEVTVTSKSRFNDHGSHLTVVPRQQDVKASDRSIVLLSLLRLPGLRVDPALGKIQVDGGSPVLLINGKEQSGVRFNNIDPAKILRIEYSNNPGIRYLDRGATGIINIILREAEDGGAVWMHGESAFTTGFANAYAGASYHKGRSEFMINYNMSYRDYNDDPMELNEQFIAEGKKISRDTKGNTLMDYVQQNISAEYTYQHNDSTMFVASFGSGFNNHHSNSALETLVNTNGVESRYGNNNRRHMKMFQPKLDLYFKHKMKHGQELELNVVNEWANNSQDATQTHIFADGTSTAYPVMVKNTGWAISSEAVYSKEFGKHKLRTGAQYQFNHTRNDYEVQDIVSRMDKNNAYVFAELQGMLGERVNYSVGTGMKAFYVKENDANKSYLRNLSMARMGWRINEHWTIIGDASFVPHLPSLSDLTTVFQRNDDIEAVQGNANLKPSSSLGTHLTARYQSGGAFYANLYFGNEHVFDAVLSSTRYDEATGYFVMRPENSTYFNGMWQQAEFGVKNLWDHLTISLDVAWKHQESKGEGFHYTRRFVRSDINASYVYKNFVAGCGFNITPDWNLAGEYYHMAERQQYIYAQYKLKNWSFDITWHCPFNSKGYEYKSECWSKVHPLTHRNNIGNNGNMITLGVTWNANFGKSFKKSEKTLQNGGYDSGIVR